MRNWTPLSVGFLCLLLTLCACDRGNDPYTETESIAVSGSETSAVTVAENDSAADTLFSSPETNGGEVTEDVIRPAESAIEETVHVTVESQPAESEPPESENRSPDVELPKVEFD